MVSRCHNLGPVLCPNRRGLKLDVADEEADNKYREPYFNFYDARLMGVEWAKQPNVELTTEFFRLLALCHTVIPDGERQPAVVPEDCQVHMQLHSLFRARPMSLVMCVCPEDFVQRHCLPYAPCRPVHSPGDPLRGRVA